MIYVASPYSSPLKGTLKAAAEKARYEKAVAFVTHLMKTMPGCPVFSPIAYCHPIAVANTMPGDAGTWMRFNMAFLRKADALFVLRIAGWEQSKGMEVEMNIATMLNIPIAHFNDKFEEIVLQ